MSCDWACCGVTVCLPRGIFQSEQWNGRLLTPWSSVGSWEFSSSLVKQPPTSTKIYPAWLRQRCSHMSQCLNASEESTATDEQLKHSITMRNTTNVWLYNTNVGTQPKLYALYVFLEILLKGKCLMRYKGSKPPPPLTMNI